MYPNRRTALKSSLGLLAAASASRLLAQPTFPSGPVRFVIPTPVGGGQDSMMRTVGIKLGQAWGQPGIVDSKPGASGAIAVAAVARAVPDGHSLLMIHSGLLTNLALLPNPGYKLADLVPVCMLVLTPIAIGARATLGVNTLQDYVALAKAKPGKLSYGSYGQGSGGHFVGELLNIAAGIDTVHVPYKGEAPAITDLLGEQIDAAVVSLGAVSRHPGKIRPLAVASPTRSTRYPDTPTFAEAGLPAVNMPGWGAIFAPAGTPKPVVKRLTAELTRIIMLPDVASQMLELGFESVGWDAERLGSFVDEQMLLIKKLVDSGRVKL